MFGAVRVDEKIIEPSSQWQNLTSYELILVFINNDSSNLLYHISFILVSCSSPDIQTR